jgi:hypothetical protein
MGDLSNVPTRELVEALITLTRHQDRLAPIAQAAVGGRLEGLFQFRLFWGC